MTPESEALSRQADRLIRESERTRRDVERSLESSRRMRALVGRLLLELESLRPPGQPSGDEPIAGPIPPRAD